MTLRFQVIGGQSNVCTSQSILQACGGIAIDSSTYQAWASTARLHRVRLYAIDMTIPVTVRLTWGNGGWVGVAKDMIVSDSSLGVTFPAVIDSHPPDGALASDWFAYQSGRPDDTIFDFDVIGSSTTRAWLDIDVSFTFDMSNPSVQQCPQLTPITTSLTASRVYWASVCPTNNSVNQVVLPSFT